MFKLTGTGMLVNFQFLVVTYNLVIIVDNGMKNKQNITLSELIRSPVENCRNIWKIDTPNTQKPMYRASNQQVKQN
jgi:hypothetical protein